MSDTFRTDFGGNMPAPYSRSTKVNLRRQTMNTTGIPLTQGYQDNIDRCNSQSTGNTTLVGDTLVSPISPWSEPKSALNPDSPVVWTGPDSKMWIDVDVLSPNLLRELRKQNTQYANLENSTSMAKGAAKIKAWVRRNKHGIDIRLRRRIDEKHDEVTEISVVPDSSTSFAELEGNDCVYEMPGSPVVQELPSLEAPSRSSTGSTLGEPLPLYEPPSRQQRVPVVREDSEPSQESPSLLHRQTSSATSIIPTPTRGLSVHRTPAIDDATEDQKNITQDQALGTSPEQGDDAKDLKAGLDKVRKGLDEKHEATEDLFERLLRGVVDAVKKSERLDSSNEEHSRDGDPLLRGTRILDSQQYETATDAEPSVDTSKPRKKIHRKVTPKQRRKQSSTESGYSKPRTRKPNDVSEDDGSLTDLPPSRTSTKSLRMPHNSDPETIWQALLKVQANILGPEHPLTYQARHEFALSRVSGHKDCSPNVLSALHETLAIQTLGGHPWVKGFIDDLQTLEKLTVIGESKLTPSVEYKSPSQININVESPVPGAPADAAMTSAESSMHYNAESVSTRHGSEPNDLLKPAESPVIIGRALKAELPTIQTHLPPSNKDPTPPPDLTNPWYNTWRPPHKPRSDVVVLSGLVFAALTKLTFNGLLWLQRNYGPEPAVESGKVRVRWTCSCGQQMHDDFLEKRAGAARELEAYLNRPRGHASAGNTPISPSGTPASRVFTSSTGRTPMTTQTSWSTYSRQESPLETKPPRLGSGFAGLPQYMPLCEPPWLLTCATEDRYTPKVAHIDVAHHKITSDRDLAMALRKHYFHINRKWWRALRLRGLTTIEFVQFEVHQNRFADIRKCPDMPPLGSSEYDFEPSELIPPVGSNYLLHLFMHPEQYDGELLTYLRAPKKNGRLQLGVGFGINLVEGFLADRVWMLISSFFALASLVFAIVWAYKEKDVQGAFGVAAWICTLAALVVGWMQACLG